MSILHKSEVQTLISMCLTSLNLDYLNLSFLKDENTVGKKMARNGPKQPFILSDSFRSEFKIALYKMNNKQI